MIKASSTHKDGRPVLILGLTRKNCSLLLTNRPIYFDAKPYGFDGHIAIVGGPDEMTIAAGLGLKPDDPRIINDPDPGAE